MSLGETTTPPSTSTPTEQKRDKRKAKAQVKKKKKWFQCHPIVQLWRLEARLL